jgi:hypothetical protein
MSEITWLNCPEELPPDDESLEVILMYDDRILEVIDSSSARYKSGMCIEFSWTPYTAEKWKALTHDT